MTSNTWVTAMFAAALATAGCSSVLGLKDPTLEMAGSDAAIDAPTDSGPAPCMPSACTFGCDLGTNACKPRLWVYLTIGAFFGNGFIGTPPDVRGTADALCFDTVSRNFASRGCTKVQTHAILSVAGGDIIQVMASTYRIPVTAEVHRVDDDLLVFDNWNDLTSGSKAPHAPVVSSTRAPTEADGIAWTGFGPGAPSNCIGWTSKAMPDSGVQAHTTTKDGTVPGVTWLGQGSGSCEFLQPLLCVCWSTGN
jgi:hypothetical protein